ncbi:MAG: septum formation initiator family protein [Nitrospiraceae bacterium]|nr:septum formation initiator family protein [Nitrospiraceae bacterium]
MSANHLLRKQVVTEMKKRRLIFFTVVILGFLYLSISLLFGDAGLFRYMELTRTRKNLQRQITELSRQNEQIREQIRLLKEDPFYREKLAREEFGLAKPDEYIFQYER